MPSTYGAGRADAVTAAARRTPESHLGRATGAELRQRALANLALLALEKTEVGALMGEVAEVVREVLRVEFVCVMEAAEDRGELLLRAGRGWDEGEVGDRTISVGLDSSVDYVSMAGYAMMSKNPVRAEDLREDPRFGGCPLMRDHGVVSGAMAKIYVRTRLFGVLGAYSRQRRVFTKDEASWLGDVARVLGGTLARARAEAAREGQAQEKIARAWQERFGELQDTMEIIAASSGGREALVATAKLAISELADWCFVDLVEEKDGEPGFTAGDTIRRLVVGAELRGAEELGLAEGFFYPLDPAAPHGTPKVLRSGEPEFIPVVNDHDVLRESANDEGHLEALRTLRPKSYMVVPMRLAGRPVGALVLVSTDPGRRFGQEALGRAKDLARCAALVLAGQGQVRRTKSHLPEAVLDGEDGPTVVDAAHGNANPNGRARTGGTLAANAVSGLQPRQIDVLRLLNGGLTVKEAAAELYCTEDNVRQHLKKAYRALGVKGQSKVLAKARELGLLPRS